MPRGVVLGSGDVVRPGTVAGNPSVARLRAVAAAIADRLLERPTRRLRTAAIVHQRRLEHRIRLATQELAGLHGLAR